MEAIAVSTPSPSCTKSGSTRSLAARRVSRTSSRIAGRARFLRGRTRMAGRLPVRARGRQAVTFLEHGGGPDLLHHDAHLLRERPPAPGARLYLDRGGRRGAPAPPARRGCLPPLRNRLARGED